MSHYYISSRLANAMAGTQDPNEIYHLLMRRGTAKIRKVETPIVEQTLPPRPEPEPIEPLPEPEIEEPPQNEEQQN